MKRVTLRTKDFLRQLGDYSINISKKSVVELVDKQIVFIDKNPSFFYYENKLIPNLHFLQRENVLKCVVVDMGAVRFIVNGADIMRPGVVEIDNNIVEGEIIGIIDEKNRVALAVGVALFNGNIMQEMDSGKVVKTIHYIGDEIWKMQ